MTINDYSANMRSPKREIGMLTIFRLGLFNMALGLMAVLTLAVLNRVMISELGIPATITAGVLALSQFVAPARVWFGQLSDSKPLFGRYRTGYVRLGAIIFSIAVFFAVQAVWKLGAITQANGENKVPNMASNVNPLNRPSLHAMMLSLSPVTSPSAKLQNSQI